jgi:3-hydroxyacyl-CoA dehydrogenase
LELSKVDTALGTNPSSGYLNDINGKDLVSSFLSTRQLQILSDLQTAVKNSHVIQEQGPENVMFKQQLWPHVEQYAPEERLLWSSTSGIPASVQSAHMKVKNRLIVVHPYNPPHIMPLIEVVPSPSTDAVIMARTVAYWESLSREPVLLKKEITGFVANRLAFELLREAIHLVNEGVLSARDLDRVVESSMGPRWAVAGPFKSYHIGGGAGGIEGFMKNIGGTIQAC